MIQNWTFGPEFTPVGASVDATIAKILSTGWLAQADPALREELLNAGRIRQFADGAMIYGFQQEQVCLWGVVSGFVRIFVTMNEQDPKLAHCAGPGFWFGEIPDHHRVGPCGAGHGVRRSQVMRHRSERRHRDSPAGIRRSGVRWRRCR